MVDALVLGTSDFGRVGSTPSLGTISEKIRFRNTIKDCPLLRITFGEEEAIVRSLKYVLFQATKAEARTTIIPLLQTELLAQMLICEQGRSATKMS